MRNIFLYNSESYLISMIFDDLNNAVLGPHAIDLVNTEKILERSLTFEELKNLANDRFKEICTILRRALTQEELRDLFNGDYINIIKLIQEELDKQKEEELKELPLVRIRYFENILRKLYCIYGFIPFLILPVRS